MNEEYKKELADLKYKMEKAEKFAEKLPIFSEYILQNKISEDREWVKFSDRYKGTYYAWGINRGVFETGTNRTVNNYGGEAYKEYLFSIYVNTLCMYDSHVKFGLEEIKDKTPVFFYDVLNSNFYVTDDQIEGLLDALSEWYKSAVKQLAEHNKKEEVEALKSRLSKLEGES